MQVGDQILDVNGSSFLDIGHQEAAKLLRSSKHLMLTVKDVGKLPHTRTTYDQTQWIVGQKPSQRPLVAKSAPPTPRSVWVQNTKHMEFPSLTVSYVTASSILWMEEQWLKSTASTQVWVLHVCSSEVQNFKYILDNFVLFHRIPSSAAEPALNWCTHPSCHKRHSMPSWTREAVISWMTWREQRCGTIWVNTAKDT